MQMVLSKPQRALLAWFVRQGGSVSYNELRAAPYFEEQRVRDLRTQGFIRAEMTSTELPAVYVIADAGRAALETDRMTPGTDRRAKVALVISILALIVSALALLRSHGVPF